MDWLLSFPSTFSLLFSSFSHNYLSHGRKWRDFMHKSMSDWFCSKWLGRLEMRVLFSISVPLLLNKYIKSACQIPLRPYHIKIEPAHLLKIEGVGDWASVSSQKHQAIPCLWYFNFSLDFPSIVKGEEKRVVERLYVLCYEGHPGLKTCLGFPALAVYLKGSSLPTKLASPSLHFKWWLVLFLQN